MQDAASDDGSTRVDEAAKQPVDMVADAESPAESRADGGEADPLVGAWTWSGRVPAIVSLTATFNADNTFVFSEQVAPASLPAGVVPGSCITTDVINGTYTETVSESVNMLTWTFTDGAANQVSECSDASENSLGTPMTAEGVSLYIGEGMLPPKTVTYNATAMTLLLTSPGDTSAGVGRGAGTTFMRTP